MTRRPDPMETRSSELALAAGVDTDSRVPKSDEAEPWKH
jgi:hypothetical protein